LIIITKHKKFCGSIEATTSWFSPFLSILTLPNHPHTPKSSGFSLSPPEIFIHPTNQHTAASPSSTCKKAILSSVGAIPKLVKEDNVP